MQSENLFFLQTQQQRRDQALYAECRHGLNSVDNKNSLQNADLHFIFLFPFFRHYKEVLFASQLLEILRKLRVRDWCTAQISPTEVDIHRVSGALTNAVFFVSCHSLPSAQTLLLRVYGPSSGSLISRTRELHVLHMLSSRYQIGPQVYGTFENGRIEEYFDAVTLTPSDIRDPQISQWIGARMAELHSVNIADVDDTAQDVDEDTYNFGIAANVKAWLRPAEEVLDLPGISDTLRNELDLPRFKEEWQRYLVWAIERQRTFGTRRVFAHNDAQYGNILRSKDCSEGVDEHRQVSVFNFLSLSPSLPVFSRTDTIANSIICFRSSLLISNMRHRTQQLMILLIIFTNGLRTITAQRLMF
jgi:choline kinase